MSSSKKQGNRASIPAPKDRSELPSEPIPLFCPACKVTLFTQPQSRQNIEGPCPKCGEYLVLRGGKLELQAALRHNASVFQMGPVDTQTEEEAVPKHRLERSGNFEMKYLEDQEVQSPLGWEGGGAVRTWKHNTGAEEEPVARKPRWLWPAVGLAALGAGAAVWSLVGADKEPPPERIAPAPEFQVTMAAPEPEDEERLAAALQVWKAFATAAPEEKATYVLNASRVGEALRRYYAETSRADEELADLPLELVPGAAADRQNGIVMLGHKPTNTQTKPLLLFFKREKALDVLPDEEAGQPPLKLDWETFVQERDEMLSRFVAAPKAAATGVFRLNLEKVHLFDDSQKNGGQESKSFGLKLRTASGLPLEATAMVNADSALERRMEEQLRWNKMESATVKLAWTKIGDAAPVLKLTDFICWQYAGVGGKPEFETDLTPPFSIDKPAKEPEKPKKGK